MFQLFSFLPWILIIASSSSEFSGPLPEFCALQETQEVENGSCGKAAAAQMAIVDQKGRHEKLKAWPTRSLNLKVTSP